MNVTPATNVEYNELIFNSDLNSHAKLLALAIGKRFNWEERRDCWPSNATLSQMTGMSIKTITRAKKTLVEGGWITSTRRYDSTNIYRPTVPSEDWVYVEETEAPVSPSEETRVSEEPEVITVPENPIVGQDEAPESPTEEVVAEVFTKPEETVAVIEGQAKTVLDSSRSKELATAYYLDVNFAAGDEEVVRAAKAKMEAEYDEYRFAPEFDDYGDETLVEFILRMKNSETVNA